MKKAVVMFVLLMTVLVLFLVACDGGNEQLPNDSTKEEQLTETEEMTVFETETEKGTTEAETPEVPQYDWTQRY